MSRNVKKCVPKPTMGSGNEIWELVVLFFGCLSCESGREHHRLKSNSAPPGRNQAFQADLPHVGNPSISRFQYANMQKR